jgi:uncharacterized protein (TIRG00374 family)
MPTLMKKTAVYLGLLVSLACCVLILQNLDWKALWDAITQVHPLWLLVTIAIFYAAIYLRAIRWALLFPKEHPVAAHRLFKPTMVGFAFNNVLPSGRVGEFMRAIYVGKHEKTGVPVALGTIVTERVFDGVTIILLFVVSMAFIPPIDPEMTREFGGFQLRGEMLEPLMQKVIIGSCVLIGMLMLLMIPAVRRKLIHFLGILPLPERIHHAIEHGLEDVIRGFHAVKHPGRFLLILSYSVLIWVISSLAAQTLGWGFDGVSITLMQAIALMVIESLAVMIPAAPGYWGLYEAGIIFGFAVLNIHPSKEIALAYGLVMHLIFFLPTTVLGLWFAGQASLKPPSSQAMASLENEQ